MRPADWSESIFVSFENSHRVASYIHCVHIAVLSVIGNPSEYLEFFSVACTTRFMIACDTRLKLRCTEDEIRSIKNNKLTRKKRDIFCLFSVFFFFSTFNIITHFYIELQLLRSISQFKFSSASNLSSLMLS